MKKLIAPIIAIAFATGILFFYLMPPRKTRLKTTSPYLITETNKDKKKILIFSSRGGGGHISVMNALHEYLGEDFCTGHAFVFADVLRQIDPSSWLSSKSGGEDLYNYFLKKKWHQMPNLMYTFGSWYYLWRKNSIDPLIEKYLLEHKPDLVISVIPLVNSSLLDVSKKLDIPFLMIPTDLDGQMAFNGLNNPEYDKFHIAMSYDNPAINAILDKHKIDKKYVSYTGFAVKKAFFEPSNIRSIKADFDVPEDKPVILLLMGAQGSQDLYRFSKQLSKLEIPVHLLIAIGRSEELRKSLEQIPFPPHITKSIIGFTSRMPDLMKISDLFITKSGSVSFNEGIYGHLPMILDGTSGVLNWEKLNHQFVENYKLGTVVKKLFRLPQMVTELISDKDKLSEIKKNFEQFTQKNPEQELRLLIKKILR